jgi:hypothetical protein
VTEAEAEEFTKALGQVFSGGWRLILHARQQGIPQALGMSTPQWVESRLGGYVRMAVEERREAVKELTAPPEDGGQGLSQREAADVLGVGETTVRRDLKPEPAPNGAPEAVPDPEPEPEVTSGLADAEFDWSEPEEEPETAPNGAPEAAAAPDPAVADFIDSSPDVQRARYLNEFFKALCRSDDFMEFDPAELGHTADKEVAESLASYRIRVNDFITAFERAAGGLRVISGGRS